MFKRIKSIASILLYGWPVGQTIDYLHMFGSNLNWFSLTPAELNAGSLVAIVWLLTIIAVEIIG